MSLMIDGIGKGILVFKKTHTPEAGDRPKRTVVKILNNGGAQAICSRYAPTACHVAPKSFLLFLNVL